MKQMWEVLVIVSLGDGYMGVYYTMSLLSGTFKTTKQLKQIKTLTRNSISASCLFVWLQMFMECQVHARPLLNCEDGVNKQMWPLFPCSCPPRGASEQQMET